jgi:hypothetical protein
MTQDADANSRARVGYRNPPEQSRFQKGKSGNPNGRQKGSRNFATAFQAELKKHVPITEEGKRKRITKTEAIAKRLIDQGAAGDLKAIPIVLNEARRCESDAAGGANESGVIGQEDRAVMESIVRRIREAAPALGSIEGTEQPTANPNPLYEDDGIPQ